MSKVDEQDEQEAGGTDVEYDAPAGARYGQHHLDRYAQAGASHAEVSQLATELATAPPDEREARLDRLSSMSNQDLAGELQRRRKAADEGRDADEVAGELGSPLREALGEPSRDDNVSKSSSQTDGEADGEGAGADEPGAEQVDLDDPGKHTIEEVLAAVGEDAGKAQQVKDAETKRGRPRKSLLDDLDDIIAGN